MRAAPTNRNPERESSKPDIGSSSDTWRSFLGKRKAEYVLRDGH
jgi:hypothetical protein